MKATEVLNRYASGERDFRRANLRGQNFKGQDLSGADFSEADIQGTNFSNAILKGTNFTGAKAGLQKRWVLIQWILLVLMAALAGFFQGYSGWFIASYFPKVWQPEYKWHDFIAQSVTALTALTSISVTLFTITRHGFTIKTFGNLISAVTIVFVGIVIFAVAQSLALAWVTVFSVAVVFAITSSVVISAAVAFAGTVAGTRSIVFTVTIAISVAVIVASMIAGLVSFKSVGAVAGVIAGAIAGAFAVASFLLGFHCSRRALKGDEKFVVIRVFGIAFGALGGTQFYRADLTNADFRYATLKSTNFNQAMLTHVCWQNVQKLERARVGNSILANWAVRELLVTRNGYNKNFMDANLEGANLNGVNLESANLTRTNLSNALLQNANLKDANLREVLATEADFTGAYLTGACLESWNIDHTTTLANVDCQYVFLLEHLNHLGSRERRPHDPDRVFAPGDFEKLYSKMMNLVQILLKNGVNREAFAEAFQKLMDENPDINYQSIQAVERKGDDVLVTLEVPENTDKGRVEQTFLQSYEVRVKQLEAENAQLKLRSTELKEIAVLALTQQPTQITNTNVVGDSTVTSEQTNQSQTVNISGNVIGSTINLGEISGIVSNVVNQLPSSPDPAQPGLKELLTQLQTAIETADELSPEDKADALEQVKVLAELGQNPQTPNKEGIWRKAWKILNAPIPGLPETATIVKSFAEILPAIAKILGVM